MHYLINIIEQYNFTMMKNDISYTILFVKIKLIYYSINFPNSIN